MAYTTINKPSATAFNTNLYTGNSTATSHAVGFQPDFTWLKVRNGSGGHYLFDAIRGATKNLRSDATNAEATDAQTLKSFDSNGYTVGTSNSVNTNNETMVGWNWKANGAGSANTDGDQSTTVSANTTSGFSIVKYTGTGTTTNFGHGLGAKPNVILIKSLASNDWVMNGDFLGSTTWQHKIILNSTAAKATANNFNDQAPTNSLFYLNSGHGTTNGSGTDYIAYCFADVPGYSKFGSYLGNSADDGTFVYTGFKPALIMVKRTNSTGNWVMHDNRRSLSNGFNVNQYILHSNASTAEITNESKVDLLSNGFKFRNAYTDQNANGSSYIFMAFAEAPLVGTNGVTAKAR